MRIDQLGEFGLIERIRAALPAPGPNVIVGIGDDVAVLKASAGAGTESGSASAADRRGEGVWLATCDVQVEGAHFLREVDPSAEPRAEGPGNQPERYRLRRRCAPLCAGVSRPSR